MKDRIELNFDAIRVREEFGISDVASTIDIMALVNDTKGITSVFHPLTSRISGMSYRISKTNSMIVINSSMSYGRQRFTIAHELYHLFVQKNFNKVVICEQSLGVQKDDEEKNADTFASYFLAPFNELRKFIQTEIYNEGEPRPLDVEDVVVVEQNFGMSRQAVLYRLCIDGYLSWDDIEPMKRDVIHSAKKLGFDDKLYRSTRIEVTTGTYLELVSELEEKEIISGGKRNQYLLDAFREDIAFGLEGTGDELSD